MTLIQYDAPHPEGYRPDLPLRGVMTEDRNTREQTLAIHAECDREEARFLAAATLAWVSLEVPS